MVLLGQEANPQFILLCHSWLSLPARSHPSAVHLEETKPHTVPINSSTSPFQMLFIRHFSITSSLKEGLVEILIEGLFVPHKLKSESASHLRGYTLDVTYYTV